MDSIYKKNIVIIAEKRIINSDMNIFSNELDFSSEMVTNDIICTLQNMGYMTVYYSSPKDFLDHISIHKNDIVFDNLWGGWHSRNKRSLIAAICEAYNICYIGADAYAHSLCQDKYLSKSFLRNYTLSVPKAMEISATNELYKLQILDYYPCIIKPTNEGCSVGISDKSIAFTYNEAVSLSTQLLKHYVPILVEEFIDGEEISICCAGVNDKFDICEAVKLEISGGSYNGIWGYESKKMAQSKVARKVITKSFPQQILEEAKKIFWDLGKVDCMRIDGKLRNGSFYVIELSPDCSLHRNCFMATAFYSRGYTYGQMLELLINNAFHAHNS